MAYEHAKNDALETLAEPVPLIIQNAPTHLINSALRILDEIRARAQKEAAEVQSQGLRSRRFSLED